MLQFSVRLFCSGFPFEPWLSVRISSWSVRFLTCWASVCVCPMENNKNSGHFRNVSKLITAPTFRGVFKLRLEIVKLRPRLTRPQYVGYKTIAAHEVTFPKMVMIKLRPVGPLHLAFHKVHHVEANWFTSQKIVRSWVHSCTRVFTVEAEVYSCVWVFLLIEQDEFHSVCNV